MDSLDRAEQLLLAKYGKMKLIYDSVEIGYVVELFQVEENGKKILKLLVLKNKKEKTTIYKLVIEEIIK